MTVLEAADEVGGTWRDNTYPGCACDIPSHLYSLSFDLQPGWSRAYPGQAEIEAYLCDVVDRHRLRDIIRFGVTVAEMRWDERTDTWAVTTTDGEVLVAEVVINGTGPLSRPRRPDIPGLDDFAGTVFHSARWDHDHDLTGERVAVIGTGASAIQFVPEIAEIAGHVEVFQRTAPWVLPRDDRPVPDWKRRLYTRLPFLARLHRWRIYVQQELSGLAFLGHDRITRQVVRMGTDHIAGAIDDSALRSAVTPTYSPGCKRILLSNEWYPTLTRQDVDLVTTPIERVTPGGVRTVDGGEHAADTIVLGTGFAVTEFLAPMKVFGAGGMELSEQWRSGAATHLGIAVAGFPNLFLLAGPNTGLGHNSIVFMIEAQLHWILGALRHRATRGSAAVEVRADVQAASYEQVQERMQRTVWLSGCDSWYRSADGRIDTLWPGFSLDYWRRTRRFDPSVCVPDGSFRGRTDDSETVTAGE